MSGQLGVHIPKSAGSLPSAPNWSGNRSTAFSGENPQYTTRVAKILEAGPAVAQLIAPNFVVEDNEDNELDAWLRAKHKKFVESMASFFDLDAGLAEIEEPTGHSPRHLEILKPETITFIPPNIDTQGDTL